MEQGSVDKMHKTSEKVWLVIENNSVKHHIKTAVLSIEVFKDCTQETSCIFLAVGSLHHPCLRCLRPWSLAAKEGMDVLIMALCAGRICCRSVSENSCEKHKLIPRDLGARTTQFYNNRSLVTAGWASDSIPSPLWTSLGPLQGWNQTMRMWYGKKAH